jgi:hypothetical protein
VPGPSKGIRAGFSILRGGVKDRSHARELVRWGCLTQPLDGWRWSLTPPRTQGVALLSAVMATASIAPSPLCRPEEDPFLLLESTLHTVQEILDRHRGKPLRRAWLDQPYGEEEITRLEEEMLPALKRFVARIADIDDWILVEMEFMQRCRLESERMHIAGMRPALR